PAGRRGLPRRARPGPLVGPALLDRGPRRHRVPRAPHHGAARLARDDGRVGRGAAAPLPRRPRQRPPRKRPAHAQGPRRRRHGRQDRLPDPLPPPQDRLPGPRAVRPLLELYAQGPRAGPGPRGRLGARAAAPRRRRRRRAAPRHAQDGRPRPRRHPLQAGLCVAPRAPGRLRVPRRRVPHEDGRGAPGRGGLLQPRADARVRDRRHGEASAGHGRGGCRRGRVAAKAACCYGRADLVRADIRGADV
ncbi:hypothetical protein E4U42_001682, partial [Claviceps africana]